MTECLPECEKQLAIFIVALYKIDVLVAHKQSGSEAGDSKPVILETHLDEKIRDQSEETLAPIRRAYRRAAIEHFSSFPSTFVVKTSTSNRNVFSHFARKVEVPLRSVLLWAMHDRTEQKKTWPQNDFVLQIELLFAAVLKIDKRMEKWLTKFEKPNDGNSTVIVNFYSP